MTTRILIVDDSKRWRLFVRSILDRSPWFQVVGEACDGVEAVTKATALLPHVVLLDIGMPRLNGIEAAKRIKQVCPASKVIFLTQETDLDVQNEALATGAVAYVLKTRAGELQNVVDRAMLHQKPQPRQPGDQSPEPAILFRGY